MLRPQRSNTATVSSDGAANSVNSTASDATNVVTPGSVACAYSLSPGGEAFPAAGGAGSIAITTSSGCEWNVSNTLSWIAVASGASGAGSGSVTYRVSANTGAARSGSLTVAGLAFAVQQANGAPTGLVFAGSMAQLASGGFWNTTITLVNTGAAPAEAFLNFFDDNGNPLLLPLTFPQTSSTTPLLASTLDETIGAGAELVVQTAGTGSQATQAGWAQLLANGNIGGTAVFGWTIASAEQEAVAPVETRNPSAFVLSFDNTGGTATGVALANVSNQAVSVPVVLRDGAGASLGSAAIPLAAYGHTAFMLAATYPATAGRLGTLELDTPAGGQIGALGIRATQSGAITSIPALAK